MSFAKDDADTMNLRLQAIDWLIRLRDDALGDEDMRLFAEWLAQDYRHSEAFAYAEDLFDEMAAAASRDVATATASLSAPNISRSVSRSNTATDKSTRRRSSLPIRPSKTWSRGLAAVAAVWLFAVTFVLPDNFHPFDSLTSDYSTGFNELRAFELTDGSRILLNTDSAVSINFDDSRRQIILHHGQVRFTVAEDRQRAFDVRADQINVRALGTVFEVYHRPNAEETDVIVQEHSVQVDLLGGNLKQKAPHEQASGMRLTVGQKLSYRRDGNLSNVTKVDLGQATAWQRRRLVIDDQPLSRLIEEINRYRVGRIYVMDDQLSNMHITGVFSLEDPDQVLESVCQALGLRETKLAGWWVLLHR